MPAITCNPGPTATAGFSPTSVGGCALWLDAADASTITYGTGSSVASWKDKINNYAVANSTAAYQPVYSQGTIRFNGITSPSYLDIPTLTIGSSAFSIFLVIQNTGPASGIASFPHFFWPLSGNGSGALSINGWISTNIQGINNNISYTLSNDQYYVLSYTFGVTSNFEQLYANGTSIGTYQKASAYVASLYRLGAIDGSLGTYCFDGNIGEILIYNRALTNTERQSVEGYLAQKWGLTSSLPVGHPGLTTNYASIQPRVFRITPFPGTHTPFSLTWNNPVVPILTTTTFAATGADQTFTVPTTTTSVTVYMWGAAGGGGYGGGGNNAYAGAGAYVQGTLAVTPGATLTIVVGKGGIPNGLVSTYGGGGSGINGNTCGSGGGRSAIQFTAGIDVATVAGGGGGGYYNANGTGGAGDAITGTGAAGSAGAGGNAIYGGKGGTQSAGGAAGTDIWSGNPMAGSKYQGGNGSTYAGSGGGGGYYGGGGGGAGEPIGGGGGGGSSLTTALTGFLGYNSSDGHSTPYSGTYNPSSIYGAAGGPGSTGGDGRVVLVYYK